jgi:hypothetical protein
MPQIRSPRSSCLPCLSPWKDTNRKPVPHPRLIGKRLPTLICSLVAVRDTSKLSRSLRLKWANSLLRKSCRMIAAPLRGIRHHLRGRLLEWSMVSITNKTIRVSSSYNNIIVPNLQLVVMLRKENNCMDLTQQRIFYNIEATSFDSQFRKQSHQLLVLLSNHWIAK